MCRFIVYHGPAITMASLVTEPEHAMLQLAMKAFCCATPVNADGFGISWYHPEIPVPGVFKDITPAWNNPNLTHIARAIKSHCFFAHVRAASMGGVTYPNCHPFIFKNISFMHNGTVPYFKQIKRALISRVSERAFQLIQGTTDSEAMFALFVTNFERVAGLSTDDCNTYHQDAGDGVADAYEYTKTREDHTLLLVAALKATLRQVHFLTLQHEYKAGIQARPAEEPTELEDDGAGVATALPATCATGRLNLAVSDGQSTCTTRYASSPPETAHSLYYSTGSKFECLGTHCHVLASSNGITPPASPCIPPRPISKKERVVIVSSEPLANGYNCEEVPVNHMVVSGPNAYFSIESCT